MQQVDRNDPCPCGSGKKYKKCCINKTPLAKSTMTVLQPTSSGLVSKVLSIAKPEEMKSFSERVFKIDLEKASSDMKEKLSSGESETFDKT